MCAWGRQLYVTNTGGSSGGNLPTPCGQDCASPVILCHTSYVGRGLNLERPRRKANHLRTLHPGHALGIVGKRVGGMIEPRRQTNCSLGQGRASPAQYLPHPPCRARGKFGSYSAGNPLFQKWQKCSLKQSLGKVAKVLSKSVLGSKLLCREANFDDFGPDFLQKCHFVS